MQLSTLEIYNHLLGVGYYSNVLHAYPTTFYPIIYPYATGATGIILLLKGMGKHHELVTFILLPNYHHKPIRI